MEGAPLCATTASFHLQQPLGSHLPQHVAHHVSTDSGAVVLDIGNAKGPKTPGDCCPDLVGLRTLQRVHAVLELAVGTDQHAPDVIEPGVRIVAVLVPPARAAFERVVVGVARLFDDAFEADVAPDAVVKMVEQEQREETRRPAVAVAERVNTEEVECSASR